MRPCMVPSHLTSTSARERVCCGQLPWDGRIYINWFSKCKDEFLYPKCSNFSISSRVIIIYNNLTKYHQSWRFSLPPWPNGMLPTEHIPNKQFSHALPCLRCNQYNFIRRFSLLLNIVCSSHIFSRLDSQRDDCLILADRLWFSNCVLTQSSRGIAASSRYVVCYELMSNWLNLPLSRNKEAFDCQINDVMFAKSDVGLRAIDYQSN